MAAGSLTLTPSNPAPNVGEQFEISAAYGDPDERTVTFTLSGRDLQGNAAPSSLIVGSHDALVLDGPLTADDPNVTITPDPDRPLVWLVTINPAP